MATGSWDFTLLPETPNEVRNLLTKFDMVTFLPGKVAGVRSGATQQILGRYYDAAIFSGVVLRRTRAQEGRQSRIGGASIVWWAGGQSAIGPWYDVAGGGYSGTTTLGVRLIAFFVDPDSTNGLTLGTTTGISANNFADAQPSSGRESTRTAIDRFCTFTTKRTEWWISPAGVWNFSPYDAFAIYPGDSTVIIGRDIPEEHRSDYTLVPIKSMDVDEDYSEVANRVDATDGTNYASHSTSGTFSWDGFTDANLNVMLPAFDSTPDGTAMSNACTAAITDNYTTRYRYKLELDGEFCLANHMAPGARFYLWDIDAEQTDSSFSSVVVAGGKQLAPKLVRCTGMTYPITPHMGVYGWKTSDASLDFVDFGPWIDYSKEPQVTTVDVGAPPKSLGRAIRNGIGKGRAG